MNMLTRWDPMQEFQDFEKRLGSWFGRAPVSKNGEKESMRLTEWAPLVDITEDDKEYLIKADLPEMKKDDIKVTVREGILTLSGERKYEKEEKDKKYHRVERAYGSFQRSFSMPDDTDESKVSAQFKDGVMQVHLPKSEKAKVKTHEIKVG
ncbi:MAG: molecular chaperone [Nitrospirales bacterium]|nr:MAG: molecular chaperone [Nitrospirales bacterium]